MKTLSVAARTINLKESSIFLRSYNEHNIHTFQTFDDSKKKGRAHHFTGAFDDPEIQKRLIDANQLGCGVFVMTNEGNGMGR